MAAFLSAEMTTWIFVGLLVVLVVVLLVVPMFTNKKRAKQTMDLHNSLMPGDVIKTVGGIIGTIKEIKQISPTDREMIIETGEGDNKSTMTFDIQALYQILERAARPESSEVFSAEKNEPEVEHADVAAEAAPEAKAEAPVEEKEQVAEAAEEVKEEAVVADETAATETVTTEEHEASEEQAAVEEKPAVAPKAKKAGSSNSAGKKKTTAAKK